MVFFQLSFQAFPATDMAAHVLSCHAIQLLAMSALDACSSLQRQHVQGLISVASHPLAAIPQEGRGRQGPLPEGAGQVRCSCQAVYCLK